MTDRARELAAETPEMTRTLAKFFKQAVYYEGDLALMWRQIVESGRTLGLVDKDGAATDLGRAALRLAEGA